VTSKSKLILLTVGTLVVLSTMQQSSCPAIMFTDDRPQPAVMGVRI